MSQGLPPGTPRMVVNKPVFFISSILIVAFLIFGSIMPDTAGSVFGTVQSGIVAGAGWFYMMAVAVFLVFIVGLAVSSYGDIKLGPDESEPDFSYPAWFAMLFSAGMGIGLMFFGVAEPMLHYLGPPVGPGQTIEAAREAMRISFFHWGVHAWAIYAVVGLSLAYFAFRHGLPLTIRSALYPIFGDRIQGPIGHTVDILAVFGTMFGVATSLGLGVLQINAGLAHLFGVPEAVWVQLALIVVITLFATLSVVAGLDAGIRRISELNLLLAVVLLVFVLVFGPTLFLFQALVQNTGAYLSSIVAKTFSLYAYEPKDWMGGWTLFYWGWWIAWSPFVGMFIARISRGRTIRAFVVGVLFVPVGFTFMWLTVFGNTAIAFAMGPDGPALIEAVKSNIPVALFVFLEQFPLSGVVSVLATVLVVTFFVTSSDSASLVIDTITAGGREDGPVWQRVFWALSEGGVAAVLLLAGGLTALQTASIASALPFSVVMLLVAYGLYASLKRDRLRRTMPAPIPYQGAGAPIPWQRRLAGILTFPGRDRVDSFLADTVRPALAEVAEEFRRRGFETGIEQSDGEVELTVRHEGAQEFRYAVRARGYARPDFAFAMRRRDVASDGDRYWRAEVHLAEGSQRYDVLPYDKEQVLADVLGHYQRHVDFLCAATNAGASRTAEA